MQILHKEVYLSNARKSGSQLNKQTLSLDKLGFLKHLASIQGTLQFCVFNSQLYNGLHHTCCAQKDGEVRENERAHKGKRREVEKKRDGERESEGRKEETTPDRNGDLEKGGETAEEGVNDGINVPPKSAI